MRALAGLILGGLAITLLAGCRPTLSEEEFGTVVFEIPDIPGTEAPYKLPDSPTGASSPIVTTPSDAGLDLPVPP